MTYCHSSDEATLSHQFKCSYDVIGPNIDVVGDANWSTEVQKWYIYCVVTYPAVADELCAPKNFDMIITSLRC